MAVYQDKTEEQKLQEHVIRQEKAESMGLLAGGIAHDFNNLLTSIMGNISLAKLDLGEKNEMAEISELLNEAEEASGRARDLTNQLLTFSKGGAPIKQLSSISETVQKTAIFSARGAKHKIEFQIEEQIFPVKFDQGQISQVIQNITLNAIQAMEQEEAKTITISIGNCAIKEKNAVLGNLLNLLKPGNYVQVSIQDEGPGISQTNLDKIFDLYFSTKKTGNGLGLAICHSIISRHNGLITVDSTVGEGTSFTFYLPADEIQRINSSSQTTSVVQQ